MSGLNATNEKVGMSGRDSSLQLRKKGKNMEELILPDPVGMRKRVSRANHSSSLHDTSFGSRKDSSNHHPLLSKLNPIAELHPLNILNSEGKRHAKYQQIIDTLLAD